MQHTTTAGVPALVFHTTTFDIVDRSGQPWLRGNQIASALGYSDASSVTRLYARNADEFTAQMTASVKLTDPSGGQQETRIFSLRGAHLIGMLANTAEAKAFRAWVLDVVEHHLPQRADPGDYMAATETNAVIWQQITLLREMLAPRMLADNPQWRKAVRVYGHFGPGKLSHAECAKLMDMGPDTWRKLLVKLDALGVIEYRPNPGQSAAGKLARQRDKARGVLSNNFSPEHMRKMNLASRVAKARNKAATSAEPTADGDDAATDADKLH